MTSLAGIKFTETEPVYGDQYGQIAVSLNPTAPNVRGLDAIIEGMRESVIQTPGRATVSFLKLSGGPPTAKPISVKVRAGRPRGVARRRRRGQGHRGANPRRPRRGGQRHAGPRRAEPAGGRERRPQRRAGPRTGRPADAVARGRRSGGRLARPGREGGIAGPRRAAHRDPDSRGARRSHRPARRRHDDAGRAAGRGGTRESGPDPALEPAPRHHRGGRPRQGTNRYPGREQSAYARNGSRSGRAIPVPISIFPASSTTSTNRSMPWDRCSCSGWG